MKIHKHLGKVVFFAVFMGLFLSACAQSTDSGIEQRRRGTGVKTAEDAVQETFVRIAKNFHKVGNIKATSTKNFFILITRRVCLNMQEREEKFSTATEEEINVYEKTCSSDSLSNCPCDESDLIQSILQLPESLRNVLYLQAVYGFNGKETANLLGISVDAVWKRTSRARAALEKELEKNK